MRKTGTQWDTPHQKCKKIFYNSHHKNAAYECPHSISAGLYQLNPHKHITQHHQPLSKSLEPSCLKHLQNEKMDPCNILYETASLATITYRSHSKLLTIVHKTLHGM